MELKTAIGAIPMVIANEKGDFGYLFDGEKVHMFGNVSSIDEHMIPRWQSATNMFENINRTEWKDAMIKQREDEVITNQHGIAIERHTRGRIFSHTYRCGNESVTFTYNHYMCDGRGELVFSGDLILGLKVAQLYRKHFPNHIHLSSRQLPHNIAKKYATEKSQEHAKEMYDKIMEDMKEFL